jgi:hypothetical protein
MTCKNEIPGTKKLTAKYCPDPAYTKTLIRIAHKNEYPFSAYITPKAVPINKYPVSTGIVYGKAF